MVLLNKLFPNTTQVGLGNLTRFLDSQCMSSSNNSQLIEL